MSAMESNKVLVLNNGSAEDVARSMIESGKQKEPFFVFDIDEANRRIQYFKQCMPRVQIFYGMSIIFAVPTKPAHWMTLLIRIKVEGDSVYKLGDKFGCDFETEAFGLLDEAAALDVKVVGVAFHVGSACSSADSHLIGLQRAKALFDYEEKAGRKMSIVDIGGGFLSDSIHRIDQVSSLVNSALDDLFPDQNIQVIAEPGRYICDSSMSLYCSLSNVRRVTKGDQRVNMVYMNDGLYGSLRYVEAWHTVKRFETITDKSIEASKAESTILWGPSCDSFDRVKENIKMTLPQCSPLDWLVFPIHGAYTLRFASNFSCLPKPLIRSVISRNLWYVL
ncbi:unnamed protein product, partial [Leptidea sinapis]